MSSGSESDDDETLSLEVRNKYTAAAAAANSVISRVIGECTAGKNILQLCELGDRSILSEISSRYKGQKELERGIAFPTCISVNHVAGHYSPEPGDKDSLKEGDVVKIDLGVHLDGFIAVAAHTHIVGNSETNVTTGKIADAVCAAHLAGEAVLRVLKPGNKNTDVPAVIKKIADTFHVNTVEAVLSHQMKRYVIDGTKVIPIKTVADQAVEEFEFEEHDVFAIDIVVSTGSGKTRELDLRPTIYKRAVEQAYSLKLKSSRKIYSEINEKFPAFPFSIRALEEGHARFGLTELEKHGLLHPYPILYEKKGDIIAQFKYTALIGPLGASRITGQPLPYVNSEYSVEDSELKELLSQGVKMKAGRKKRKTKPHGSSDPIVPVLTQLYTPEIDTTTTPETTTTTTTTTTTASGTAQPMELS